MPRPTKPMARTRIKPRSDKRILHMRESRVPKIEAAVAAGRGCEVCPQIAAGGHDTHCAGRIQGMHERRKSGQGGSRENDQNLVPACNWGNVWIEDNPAAAKALPGPTLVVSDGDPEWQSLSKRLDKMPAAST